MTTGPVWLDDYYSARHAWELTAEQATMNYPTELAEYRAAHPAPTLRQRMEAHWGLGAPRTSKGYLAVLVQALAFYREGSEISIDDVRTELTGARQIPPESLGPTFGLACQKGYLIPTQTVIKTRWRPGKGRLIRVYTITAKARAEAREQAGCHS